MKLYSKGQLIFYSIISSAIAVSLTAVVFASAITPNSPDSRASKPESESLIDHRNSQDNRNIETNINSDIHDDIYTSNIDTDLSLNERVNINIYRQLNHAVVNISTITFSYNWFLEPVPMEGGSGSGSIIDQDGLVLTNYHVIENADRLSITLSDGSEYQGKIVGADPENDLAVIKFNPDGKKLTTIPFGKSFNLAVGQKVLAIGNPFGLERTLTEGIISALGRPIKTESGLIIKETIQTDASINPGNSGGPLLNSKGQMIGVNTMIVSPSGGSVGIGFAVPIDTARRVIPDLIKFGTVKRGWIEIVPVQLFPALVRYADYPVKHGILISQLIKGGNAAKTGLRGGSTPVRYGRSIIYIGGDIIVEIDGMVVSDLTDLYSSLEDNKPGESVLVKVLRNSKYKTFNIILSERPKKYSW